MRKLLGVFVIFVAMFLLIGCTAPDEEIPLEPIKNLVPGQCDGAANYFLINDECVFLTDFISDNISVNEDETRVEHMNSVELMTDFVADLTGSTGLAVISRDAYENAINLGGLDNMDIISLATTDEYQDTQNLIVKLTEDGFFEEVSFMNESGQSVEITSNPLALEVYGAYTVVVFEITYNNTTVPENFAQKVYDSFYAGGIYLIHNESGKMFATKDVIENENVYYYQEDHSRTVNLTVTLNEPVVEIQYIPQVDEFNMPILDEFGNMIYDEVLVPVVDDMGNPLIFTEGPILTEEQMIGLVKYYEQQIVDEDGNPMFDEENKPIFELIEEPVLDEFGNQIFELQIVPVFDEFGNVQYQQEFEVELYINDIRDITITEYYATVTDNPITPITQRFVDKIISEYFNWNYYRINNYMISSYGFSAGNEDIYYITSISEEGISENYVMKLSFDIETNELTLERYINATKAGFTNCEIILDPRNNSIICDPWDGSNMKVYSQTHGLKTIPNSDNLQPVTFPNGELYFYDNQQTYVEELHYYTTLLYNINSDGTLTSHYIELGEKDEICQDNCINGLNINMYHNDTDPYAENQYINIQTATGEKIMTSADLEVSSLGEFSSFRPSCNDINGCWYNVQYEILDELGETLITYESSKMVYPGDPVPKYQETYQIDENSNIQYEQVYSDTDVICDNASGCASQINLVDNSINQYGVWLYGNFIVPQGEKFISTISLPAINNGTYEYTKELSSEVCNYETCDEYILIRIYDDSDQLLSETHNSVQILEGEYIPLYIEYHITADTTVTMSSTVCTTSTGCTRYYETYDQKYYWINYDQGDSMYETITFVETDRQLITEKTLTNQVCTDINGCYGEETEYIIVDDFGTELYHFKNYLGIEYGELRPYKVTININDTDVNYMKEALSENRVCETDNCRVWVAFTTDINDYASLGSGYVVFHLGDEIYNRVIMTGATPVSFQDELTCNIDEGCVAYTDQYKIVDEFGNEYQLEDINWYINQLPVHFAKGDKLPVDSNFEVTFLLSNVEYLKTRINVYDFIYSLNNVTILDDNVYLIEKQSWVQGNENFILIFDEVEGKYYAKYTNISAFTEITKFEDGYIAINDDENAIINFTFNEGLSNDDYYYFDVEDLTAGLEINGVNDLVVDYDGSIYFRGVDNFINDITGSILDDGTVIIDTEIVEFEIVRLRPIN
ncbi:MAG: hypothetical protein KKH01_07715 [Firmicutes bacterium]|nr:hypothetical protein [Bacillota bacterium]